MAEGERCGLRKAASASAAPAGTGHEGNRADWRRGVLHVPVSSSQVESERGAKVLRSVASIPQKCDVAGSLYHFSTHN